MIKFGPEAEVIHALPVASSIKRYLPCSRVIWITDETGIELLEGHADIDYLFNWARNKWIRDFPYPHRTISVMWEISRIMLRLKQERIDIILDLEGSSVSAILSRWTGCPVRILLDRNPPHNKWIRGLYTRILDIPKEICHSIERNLFVLEGIGIKERCRSLEIQIPEELEKEADSFFYEKKPFIDRPVLGIYPGANYRNRCWEPEKFSELIDIITEKLNINCLLLWFPGELDMIKRIERRMKSFPFRAYPARGKSMLALIKRCNLVITGDSALIQMSNIEKVPVLGLFGPTSPQRRGPVGLDDVVIQGALPCVPCDRLYCNNPICMNTIKVDKVADIVAKVLDKKA
ncbi:MAG: glycosyltransferase family 9 protein [bacterium]